MKSFRRRVQSLKIRMRGERGVKRRGSTEDEIGKRNAFSWSGSGNEGVDAFDTGSIPIGGWGMVGFGFDRGRQGARDSAGRARRRWHQQMLSAVFEARSAASGPRIQGAHLPRPLWA